MDVRTLEAHLDGAKETDVLDFKGPIEWSAQLFAKDILAMANVEDGGLIIVGVEETADGKFVRRGISAEQKATFQIDTMRDQVAPYADPHVRFMVEFEKDSTGLEYAIISVEEFSEVPTICRKDSADTNVGNVYFRSHSGRPASARVSNVNDMRAILDRSAVKLMKRLQRLGLAASEIPAIEAKLEKELAGL
jgi:predicted HTH transcriptional regulator